VSALVDWELAGRIARVAAGEGGAAMKAEIDLGGASARAERAVIDYTGLSTLEPVPEPEWVSRREWATANLDSMRELIAVLEQRVSEARPEVVSGPLGAIAGRVLAIELGGLVGLASRRVLGQYEFPLLGEREPRLLFVGENIEVATADLDAGPAEVLEWIAAHEVTHAVHFASAPWLRGHMGGLARSLLADAPLRIEPRELLAAAGRLISTDPRRLIAELRHADPVTLLAPAASRETIARVQSTMAAIEGYAEHVMDAAAEGLGLDVAKLRAGLERRRQDRGNLARVLSWLLGFEMKLRQYREGKRFCDEVVERAGIGGLNRAWDGAESLPSATELGAAETWIARCGSTSVAA